MNKPLLRFQTSATSYLGSQCWHAAAETALSPFAWFGDGSDDYVIWYIACHPLQWADVGAERNTTPREGGERERALDVQRNGAINLARARSDDSKTFRTPLCAEHLTVESYTVFICQQSFTVIWYSITHLLFLSRLKTFLLCKSFPLQPFFSST